MLFFEAYTQAFQLKSQLYFNVFSERGGKPVMLDLQMKWDSGAQGTVLAKFFNNLEGGLLINCHDWLNLTKECVHLFVKIWM